MERHDGWWWYGIDMEQAATYKYSEGDIDSARQFSKAAVLMCVRVGAGTYLHDVQGTCLEAEELMNYDKNMTNVIIEAEEGNEVETKRPLQSCQEIRKFAKGGTTQGMEEVGMGKETQSAGDM